MLQNQILQAAIQPHDAEEQSANRFSIPYLESLLRAAKAAGYDFVPLGSFLNGEAAAGRKFTVRLDLDFKPKTLAPFSRLARELGIPFTVFVRVLGPYNPLWHACYPYIREAAEAGCEIGLHTAAVEWARYHGSTSEKAFAAELSTLRSVFDVDSVAPHRDVNYSFNTLPWLEANWDVLQRRFGLRYQAYDQRLFEHAVYVNEGLSPHLNWRGADPFEVIQSGKSIYMLLHPHWWFESNPFEHD